MLDDTTLEMTLKVFADNGMKLNKCAKALFIHRNTLKHRLFVIKNQTQKDPQDFHELAELLGYEKKKTFDYKPIEFDAQKEMCSFCRDWRLGDCDICKEA